MKIHKSKINTTHLETLPKTKISISMEGDGWESVWVAKDEEHRLYYLLNAPLMFYPMNAWGMELPMENNQDLHKYRGDSFDETEFTVAAEAYDHLVGEGLINIETDEFNVDKYFELINKPEEPEEDATD